MVPSAAIMSLMAALLWVSGAAAASKTARDANELLGPVHRVATTTPAQVITETYDPPGNLEEVIIDDLHERSKTRYVFTYDQLGRLHEEIGFDGAGNQLYRKVFAYTQDPQERTSGAVAASGDGDFHHAEFSLYDERGNLTETLFLDRSQASRNLFDVLGRLLYSARFQEGQLLGELAYRYDADGRLVEVISYDAHSAITGKLVNAYDDKGRRVRATTERLGELGTRQWISTYEVDEAGNWTKEWITEGPAASSESAPPPPRLVQERVIEYYTTP